ncbi:MAG: hypothetical protein ACI8V2_002503 [Candidatus Latescibacterota bacterium]|jgi:hypothetical protein
MSGIRTGRGRRKKRVLAFAFLLLSQTLGLYLMFYNVYVEEVD